MGSSFLAPGPWRRAGGMGPALLRLLLVAALAGCAAEQRTFVDRGQGGGGGTDGASGTGGGGGASSDSASSTGSGGSCTAPPDCPLPAEPCQIPACVDGRCGTAPLPEDTEIAPTAGDCQRIVCDGRGAQRVVAADEPEDDDNPCTSDTCDGTMPVHSPLPGACPGGRCDDAGHCVPTECERDAECGASTECYRTTCNNGLCEEGPVPAGTLCNAQQDQCDGAGHCVDCVNSGGCGECCVCSASGTCVPA
ncbi:hypothetical protein WMF04_39160 [Sorangium sp. So ce260]|uniref:hypothetical protein n=1 Tax=Sorangium sp. So ce260 TaxID=3133291 RepID=UPI003F5F9552